MIRVLVELPSPRPERIRVQGERYHYLARVLRLRPGQSLEVFDGAGRAFAATVAAIDEESVELVLGEACSAQPQRRITVIQALPKAEKMEWIIEKATELGAAAILPISTARAVARLEAERAAKRIARWRRFLVGDCPLGMMLESGEADVDVGRPADRLAELAV